MMSILDETPGCSKPINASTHTRLLTLLAIKLFKRCRKQKGAVLFLSNNICIKYGKHVTLNEASTIRFVARNTSIPVPRIYCAFKHKERTYIVMERIHGEPVGRGWHKRSEEDKAKILGQIKSMVEEMRRITPVGVFSVANVDGGPVYDPRLPGNSGCAGPFRDVRDFHRYLRGGLEAHPEHVKEIRELISEQDRSCLASKFTHGDLSSLNILASESNVVGIIDWETAGWYPSYWEYTTAWNVNPQNQFWQAEVDKFIDPLPEQLAMEKVRLKYFGDV